MPNRNGALLLDRVLDRLAQTATLPGTELIVIDDGSTDASRELVRARGTRLGSLELRLLERDHGGVVQALNAGLAEARGELVVQLDNDVTVETPGWLERMAAFLGSDSRIGLVTGAISFDWGELQACGVNLIGPAGLHDRGTEPAEPTGQRTWHGAVRRPQSAPAQCDQPAEVDSGIGCCMMYRREVALELGGYDAGFSPVWFDDIDLCLSIRRQGLKAFFLPGVDVVHHVGARLRHSQPPWLRVAGALRRRASAMGPRVAGLLPAPRLHGDRREMLAGHHRYWREKWGFDLLNPDMNEVQRLWGDTEVCWRTNPEMREAGKRIVDAHAA